MVSILLTGGLGNQMFQYASAKSLAKRLNTNFVADLYFYRKKTQSTSRRYELDIFETEPNISQSFFNKLIYKSFLYFVHRPLGLKILKSLNVFHDMSGAAIRYSADFEQLKGNVLLFGYFQNEKYFENVADELRHDFRFRNQPQGKNADIADRMSKTNSVSVHIRRGDYLSQSTNLNVLDLNYYSQAISLIAEKIKNPEYFVFSDDIDWVKQNIAFPSEHVHFIDWNTGADSYKDMQLMSLCKHNIIANSSFSWWGAWLNGYTAKIVIAPKHWYKADKHNIHVNSFIPLGWIKL